MSAHSIFRRSYWQSLWIALCRSVKDPRARKQLRPVIGWLAYAAYLCALAAIIFLPSDRPGWPAFWQFAGYAVFFAMIQFYRWWEDRRDSRLAEERMPAVPVEIKLAIYREARLLAALLERAGSERLLEKEIPDHITIITRRTVIDQLKSDGFMDGLEAPYIDLFFAPDGHWNPAQKQHIEHLWEYLAVLRWALGLGEFRPLTLSPEYAMSMVKEIAEVRVPEKLPVLPSWDIRVERNQANEFFTRCWIELLARGEVSLDSQETMDEALKAREKIHREGNAQDVVVGTKVVSELSQEALWKKALRAYRRFEILTILVEITSSNQPASELHRLILEFLTRSDETPEIAEALASGTSDLP
jgi:hypothetical protein